MQVQLEVEKTTWRQGEAVAVRLLVLNDSYEPVTIDRRALIGPNPQAAAPSGLPLPVSVESDAPHEEDNRVLLNPWCFYGRERSFDYLPPGQVTIYGYLLRRPGPGGPAGPADPDDVLTAAAPIKLTIEAAG